MHILKQLILLFADVEASCLYCLCCIFCIAYCSSLCRDVIDRCSTLQKYKIVNDQFANDAVKSKSLR